MPEVVVRVHDQLAWAAAVLREAGVEEPRREAVRLWGAITDGKREGPENGGTKRLLAGYRRAVERRARGMPWQYAVGVSGFRHLVLRCDARALIPRPETEGLVDLALGLRRTGRALDVGTGNGCIALALAAEGQYDLVVGVDVSADALALARENSGLATRERSDRGAPAPSVRWVEGSWVEPVRGEGFDLVVSNPPYITTGELAGLEPAVRDWEPRLALDGGMDGLRAIERLLRDGLAVLAPGGVLVLELDSRRAPETAALALSLCWNDVTITQDSFGRDRYLAARREPTS